MAEAGDPTRAANAALRRATSRARSWGAPRPPRARGGGRDPQTLGDAVEGLLRDQGWTDQAAVARLMAQWDQIVGPDIARHATPVSFVDEELTVQATSTAWATQLRFMLPALHRAIDREVGQGVVARVRVLGPQAPSWTAGPRRVKGRGPRDTYG